MTLRRLLSPTTLATGGSFGRFRAIRSGIYTNTRKIDPRLSLYPRYVSIFLHRARESRFALGTVELEACATAYGSVFSHSAVPAMGVWTV